MEAEADDKKYKVKTGGQTHVYRQKNSDAKDTETPAGGEDDEKPAATVEDYDAEDYNDEEEYNEDYDEAIVVGPEPTVGGEVKQDSEKAEDELL